MPSLRDPKGVEAIQKAKERLDCFGAKLLAMTIQKKKFNTKFNAFSCIGSLWVRLD
jgi:hypothetical protein